MTSTAWKSRPQAGLRAAKSFGGDTSIVSHRHPDPKHRRPVAGPGEHLLSARFAQLERVALELVEDFDVEHYNRASRIYSEWSQRYAELNDPVQAKECHGISESLRCRAELIRMYPGEFSDTLAVLFDIFAERQVAEW